MRAIAALTVLALVALTAAPALALQATITWANPAPGANPPTGVKVLRGTGPDPVTFAQVGATLAAGVTTFSDPLTGVALGTRICYQVVEAGAVADATPSAQACGTPDKPASASGITIIFQP
jgi:hypothetical protein